MKSMKAIWRYLRGCYRENGAKHTAKVMAVLPLFTLLTVMAAVTEWASDESSRAGDRLMEWVWGEVGKS